MSLEVGLQQGVAENVVSAQRYSSGKEALLAPLADEAKAGETCQAELCGRRPVPPSSLFPVAMGDRECFRSLLWDGNRQETFLTQCLG